MHVYIIIYFSIVPDAPTIQVIPAYSHTTNELLGLKTRFPKLVR